MTYSLAFRKMDVPAKTIACKLQIKINALTFILMVFVAVAVVQSIQLGNMLSEARSVSEDVYGIHVEQKVLEEEYSLYSTRSSYHDN